jgi:hypothetical protein
MTPEKWETFIEEGWPLYENYMKHDMGHLTYSDGKEAIKDWYKFWLVELPKQEAKAKEKSEQEIEPKVEGPEILEGGDQ